MPSIEARNFTSPDETRTPDRTRVDMVRMGETSAARLELEPGWRWSECIKPVAGTESCQVRHVGVRPERDDPHRARRRLRARHRTGSGVRHRAGPRRLGRRRRGRRRLRVRTARRRELRARLVVTPRVSSLGGGGCQATTPKEGSDASARPPGVTNRRLAGRSSMRTLALMIGLVIVGVLSQGAMAASPRVTVALGKSTYGSRPLRRPGVRALRLHPGSSGTEHMQRRMREGLAALHPARGAARRRRHEGLAHFHDASRRWVEAGHVRGPASLLLRRRPCARPDPVPERARVRRALAGRARQRCARSLMRV